MNIVMIAPTPFFADRGTHIRILEEARALVRRGHRVMITTYHIGRDVDMEISEAIRVRRIWPIFFWYRKLEAGASWQKIFLDAQLCCATWWIVLQERPDILHMHLHEGIAIGWVIRKLFWWRKMICVADIHGQLTTEMQSHAYATRPLLARVFARLERWLDATADRVITSSDENTASVQRLSGRADVHTVLDGVDCRHDEALEKYAAREALRLPQQKTIIVYAGAFVENKGIPYLFDALVRVCADRNNLFVVLAGAPMEPADCFVRENGLEEKVRVISPLNYFHLPQLLHASDIGIDPKDSSVGQASGKILQYMGAGLPVVCFDRENNRAYLGSGEHLSQEISGAGLARALVFYLDHPEQRERDGKRNRERARTFSWDRAAEQVEQIYAL